MKSFATNMKNTLNKIKCFLGFHDWKNLCTSYPEFKKGEAILISELHECKRCKKRKLFGMGWVVCVLLFIVGCNPDPINYKKPWIVVEKGAEFSEECSFKYITASGKTYMFYDICSKYNVGDTIK